MPRSPDLYGAVRTHSTASSCGNQRNDRSTRLHVADNQPAHDLQSFLPISRLSVSRKAEIAFAPGLAADTDPTKSRPPRRIHFDIADAGSPPRIPVGIGPAEKRDCFGSFCIWQWGRRIDRPHRERRIATHSQENSEPAHDPKLPNRHLVVPHWKSHLTPSRAFAKLWSKSEKILVL